MASLQVLHALWQAEIPNVSDVGNRGRLIYKVVHAFQPRVHRIFLTGANPFVLTTNRLTDIALLIRKYVGEGHPTIGCFSRITDVRNKTVEELQQLHHLGFDYLTIGVEIGDSETLTRV